MEITVIVSYVIERKSKDAKGKEYNLREIDIKMNNFCLPITYVSTSNLNIAFSFQVVSSKYTWC